MPSPAINTLLHTSGIYRIPFTLASIAAVLLQNPGDDQILLIETRSINKHAYTPKLQLPTINNMFPLNLPSNIPPVVCLTNHPIRPSASSAPELGSSCPCP